MANSRSAEKRNRQAERRRIHNRAQRSKLKTGIKKVQTATEAEVAEAAYRETSAMLDRLATRRLIHPNKASRKKSQLAKKVQALGGKA